MRCLSFSFLYISCIFFIVYYFTLNLVVSTFRIGYCLHLSDKCDKYMKCVVHHFLFLLSGFVGTGMLSGAVAGSVFASPPPRNILHAIRCVAENNKGTIQSVI